MKTTLPQFIAEMGDAEISRRLNGTPIRTIQSWRRRERRPRLAQAQELINLSDGRLDFQAIYGPDSDCGAARAR
jgi:hypothetical protein